MSRAENLRQAQELDRAMLAVEKVTEEWMPLAGTGPLPQVAINRVINSLMAAGGVVRLEGEQFTLRLAGIRHADANVLWLCHGWLVRAREELERIDR